MKIIIVFCLLLMISNCSFGQTGELFVKYDFAKNASPPMIPFYLRVYVNDILADSTKPHLPHHNLANTTRISLEKGTHLITIEGVTLDKQRDRIVVMKWNQYLEIIQGRRRVVFKLDEKYMIKSISITE